MTIKRFETEYALYIIKDANSIFKYELVYGEYSSDQKMFITTGIKLKTSNKNEVKIMIDLLGLKMTGRRIFYNLGYIYCLIHLGYE